MEKSFAVDAPGIRRVLKAGKAAEQKNLKIAGGLMSRHYIPLEQAVEQLHEDLIGEVRAYDNTVLMSDIEGRGGQGNITGLNGLLLGVAKKRGLEAICVMGEIPVYLQGFPIPYPKASKSVLEVLTATLGIGVEMAGLDAVVERSERELEALYERLPSEIKEQLDSLRYATYVKPTELGPITEEDKQRILEDIDKFFKTEPKEGQD